MKAGAVHITVSNKINQKDLLAAVEHAVRYAGGLVGCTPCGLGGIEIILREGDPVDLGKVAGLTSATFSQFSG